MLEVGFRPGCTGTATQRKENDAEALSRATCTDIRPTYIASDRLGEHT
jgi:hypothetical protein